MKKRILSILLMLIGGVVALGQSGTSPIPNNKWYDEKYFHFGYRLGVNVMNFSIKTNKDFAFGDTIYAIRSYPRPGFTVGVIANARLHDYWELRFIPGISIGERKLEYISTARNSVDFHIINRIIETVNMDIPFEIKWKTARLKNWRAYVLAGAQYSVDMAANARKKEANPDEILIKLNFHDFSAYAGVGLSFYLPYSNIISIEFKMNFGMNDILKHDGTPYTNSIEHLMSKNTLISITFE
jgi:hypothetical protein